MIVSTSMVCSVRRIPFLSSWSKQLQKVRGQGWMADGKGFWLTGPERGGTITGLLVPCPMSCLGWRWVYAAGETWRQNRRSQIQRRSGEPQERRKKREINVNSETLRRIRCFLVTFLSCSSMERPRELCASDLFAGDLVCVWMTEASHPGFQAPHPIYWTGCVWTNGSLAPKVDPRAFGSEQSPTHLLSGETDLGWSRPLENR